MAKRNWVIFLGLPFIFVLIIESFPLKKSFEGVVVRVTDGDTIVVKTKHHQHKVRLLEIDAPELKQRAFHGEPIGDWSRSYLKKLIYGRKVRVQYIKKDIYKRFLGEVIFGNKNINQEMIKAGMAIKSKYSRSYLYHNLELTARLKNVGIFKTYSFEAPWIYRKNKKRKKYAAN